MNLWNYDDPITSYRSLRKAESLSVPQWIEQDITPSTVAAILQGGCESGAYMPAVTYYQAEKTMGEHGDDVLQYIDVMLGEIPKPSDSTSWSGLAVYYLSTAVELWAYNMEIVLTEELPYEEEETNNVN